MIQKRIASLAALTLALLLLAGCRGKALPAGMEEDELLAAGKDVMLLLVHGDYEEVHALLREDQQALYTPEEIQSLTLQQLDGAGIYKQIESSMVTGQTSNGESYGVAVLYCEFSEDEVLFRLAFDPDMALIGFAIQ